MTLLRLALRNVFRHRGRSLITLAAIACGSTAVLFVGGFFEDVFYKMREGYIYALTGHIQVYRRGYSERGLQSPFDYLIDDPGRTAIGIRAIAGVRSVAQRFTFAALISNGETSSGCIAQGVEPQLEPAVTARDGGRAIITRKDPRTVASSMITAGDPLEAAEDSGVILGKGLADSLAAKVGDTLMIFTHTVGGSMNGMDVRVRGIFQTNSKEFDDRAVRLPLAAARHLLQTGSAESLVVLLENTEDTPRVADRIRALSRTQGLDLEVKEWQELNDSYVKTRALFGRFFQVVMLVVSVVVILSVVNTMNMAVMERTSEVGTIMALGATPGDVVALFFLEGTVLGALGGLCGVALGVSVVRMAGAVGFEMPTPPGTTIRWLSEPVVVPWIAAVVLILSVVIAAAASAWPAVKAARLEIVQALRHSR